MYIKDFIPTFLVNIYRKKRIKKFRGRGNQIETTNIHSTAVLGAHIYLAHDVDIRSNVKIGDYSYCSPGTVVFSKTQIGKFCSIGYNCQIGLPEHPLSGLSTSPKIYRNSSLTINCDWPEDDFTSPPVIENDVWVGSNAMILQGVHIGNGAVIAAGAVVTKNVPDYAIVTGVPARILKYRFNEEKRKKLNDSTWWDHDIVWINEHYQELIKD